MGAQAPSLSAAALTSAAVGYEAGTDTNSASEAVSADAGDIVSWSIAYDAGSVVLGVRTRLGSDPIDDSNWQSFFTQIAWGIDTNGIAGDEFNVTFDAIFGSPVGSVTDANLNTLCDAAATFDGANGYFLQFASSCFGGLPTFRAHVHMCYDGGAGDPNIPVSEDTYPKRRHRRRQPVRPHRRALGLHTGHRTGLPARLAL